jgi:uncharacterized cupredoxin-like copper-binding protein
VPISRRCAELLHVARKVSSSYDLTRLVPDFMELCRRLERWSLVRVVVGLVSLIAIAVIVGSASIVLFKNYPQRIQDVNVTLNEWTVTPNLDTAKAGKLNFVVTNKGTVSHEFVIFKTDLPPDGLPTLDGKVEEDKLDHVDELDVFAAGKTESLTVDLTPGKYVFICNIVENPPGQPLLSHYQQGMRVAFTVNP